MKYPSSQNEWSSIKIGQWISDKNKMQLTIFAHAIDELNKVEKRGVFKMHKKTQP